MGMLNEKTSLENPEPKEEGRQAQACSESGCEAFRGANWHQVPIIGGEHVRCQKEMSEKIEISVARMEVQVERLERDMSEMKDDVKAIRATLDRASGGWKMLLVVGTISAAIGSFVTKALTLWPFGR